MRSFTTLVLLASTLSVSRAQNATIKKWIPSFENLVAFGDSYTDESRLAYFISHNGSAPPTGLLLPPSNHTAGGGVTWARDVSNYSGAKLYNYAVSGSVCSNEIISRGFPDVVYEVNAFFADSKYVNNVTKQAFFPGREANNTVYSMWIGTNDLGKDAFLTDSQLGNATLSSYVDCVFEKFDRLYANGGRYFVLMNTAPLQLSPLYGLPEAGGLKASKYWPDKPANITEISYKMLEYTTTLNTLFDYRVPYELAIAKRYPNATIAIFDVHSLLTDIYYNPSAYLTSPANVTAPYYLCNAATGSNCTTAKGGLDSYMWYDELHPSNKTDVAVAKEFVKVVGGGSSYATYW